jgi:hypothetical protein
MWEKSPDPANITWETALDAAENLDLCGYTDWRLPNVNELETLLNLGSSSPAGWLSIHGFSNIQNHYYWSSTSFVYNDNAASMAWYVSFFLGDIWRGIKADPNYGRLWAVRSGQ